MRPRHISLTILGFALILSARAFSQESRPAGGQPAAGQQPQRPAQRQQRQDGANPRQIGVMLNRESTDLVPLCDMGTATYKGEDGGLYGKGKNTPPAELKAAAEKELARIQPLNAEGQPDPAGKIVFISIGMSNTTSEFARFIENNRRDSDRNPAVVVVDTAFGSMALVQIVDDPNQRYWNLGAQRLQQNNVTPQQVQVAWVKQAIMGPRGEFPGSAREYQRLLVKLLNQLKQKYPNLRIAYLSSRIYAGHANMGLNPEPYAYESAFAVRWTILDQLKGEAALNYDPAKGDVKAPLLLWGPYLWADGVKGRKVDDLVYKREDLAEDGTHPNGKGQAKVADLLTNFFKRDPLATPWYLKPAVRPAAPTTMPAATQPAPPEPEALVSPATVH